MKRFHGYKIENSRGIGKPQRVRERDLLFAALEQESREVFAEAPPLEEHPGGQKTSCRVARHTGCWTVHCWTVPLGK